MAQRTQYGDVVSRAGQVKILGHAGDFGGRNVDAIDRRQANQQNGDRQDVQVNLAKKSSLSLGEGIGRSSVDFCDNGRVFVCRDNSMVSGGDGVVTLGFIIHVSDDLSTRNDHRINTEVF